MTIKRARRITSITASALVWISLGVWLTACANTPAPVPKSPDQALFDAHTAYVGALTVVTNYGAAPICPGKTWATGCANGPFLILAKKYSDAAAGGLAAAQPLVDAWKAIGAPNATDTARAMAAVNAAMAEVQAVSVLSDQINTMSN
jgi:hypothetical protein